MPDPQSPPALPLEKLLPLFSNIVRWRLLTHLATGDPLMVSELAERVRIPIDSASKHLALFRDAGIVTQGRNRLYQIAPQFVVDKENRILDFGHCLVRLDAGVDQT
jgi:DNA-binding transcriptional ArsR family regulator